MVMIRSVVVALVVIVAGFPAAASMVGGAATPCGPGGGSVPALFDTDGVPGPSAGDQVAYLAWSGPGILQGYGPFAACSSSTQALMVDGDSDGVWDGFTLNGGADTFSNLVVGPDYASGYVVSQRGGVYAFTLGLFTGSVSPTYISASGDVNLGGELRGWKEPGDDEFTYVALSWGAVGAASFQGCGDVTVDTLLWVPVEPVDGQPGNVRVVMDLDCNGVADADFATCPPLVPQASVPVTLQRFTLAGVIPGGVTGIALLLGVGIAVAAVGRAFRGKVAWLRGLCG